MSGILSGLFLAYFYVVAASVLMKLVGADPAHPVSRAVRSLTEPLYRRIRSALPLVVVENIDLSPAVVVAGILVAREVLAIGLQGLGI